MDQLPRLETLIELTREPDHVVRAVAQRRSVSQK
jgi:hypothetical protein